MCEKAKIKVIGKSSYVISESGSIAFVPVDRLCELAKRFNICYEELKC